MSRPCFLPTTALPSNRYTILPGRDKVYDANVPLFRYVVLTILSCHAGRTSENYPSTHSGEYWPVLSVDQPRPPAIRAASGKDLSLSIASTPSAGPKAKNAKAHRHPKASSRNGISQIVGTVRAKPPASCSVNAVPT